MLHDVLDALEDTSIAEAGESDVIETITKICSNPVFRFLMRFCLALGGGKDPIAYTFDADELGLTDDL